MRKLTSITSVAAPLAESDIDTDVIFPARFLLRLNRKGLAEHVFDGRRKAATPDAPFVLDHPTYKSAEILVAGPRFGVGSSREHAVWALDDFGIRCVIAPSFGDIFYANCFKNGVLPIRLGGADHALVMDAANAGEPVTVDLEVQEIRLASGVERLFDIAAHHRRSLLLGLDEIDAILTDDAEAISDYEARRAVDTPWLQLDLNDLNAFVAPPNNESAQKNDET